MMYTTIQGDTWDVISFKVYGTEMYLGRLMEVNTAYIGVAVFPSGINLVTPTIEPKEEATNAPPWRR